MAVWNNTRPHLQWTQGDLSLSKNVVLSSFIFLMITLVVWGRNGIRPIGNLLRCMGVVHGIDAILKSNSEQNILYTKS